MQILLDAIINETLSSVESERTSRVIDSGRRCSQHGKEKERGVLLDEWFTEIYYLRKCG